MVPAGVCPAAVGDSGEVSAVADCDDSVTGVMCDVCWVSGSFC